jgi:hypothetical protein
MWKLSRFVALTTTVVGWTALSACSATTVKTLSTHADQAADPAAWSTVHYGHVTIDVPASWPVYDETKGSPRCTRFDVHALYLGHQPPDATCPAHLVGRTDAAQIEPLDDATKAQLVGTPSQHIVNGELREDQPDAAVSRKLTAAFPSLGIVVTAFFRDDPAVAQRIVDSVRAA